MTHDFEYISYDDADRIAMLENKAAELERRLLAVMPQHGTSGLANLAMADGIYPADPAGDSGEYDVPADAGAPYRTAAGRKRTAGADGRTEALINHGRQRSRPHRRHRILAHWRMLAVGAAALVAGIAATVLVTGGSSASWPASVATVQAEIKQACENQDTAAEPSGLNFSCGKDTQSVLWVFSLLTSGDNPRFVDQATGRKGLEPIVPSQGGDIAWSLNLHHPYNPASPLDSLEVAARAINNIISGATLTSSTGSALVEPGLESKAANCQRYTGSPRLVTKTGYPARCAAPVTSGAGEQALVSDVFKQWMAGTPAQMADQAGMLFVNSGNPGNPQVQAILNSLPASGQ